MLKMLLIGLVPLLAVFGGLDSSSVDTEQGGRGGDTGTLQKMVVSAGTVTMDLDMRRLNGTSGKRAAKSSKLSFEAGSDAFFTIIVFNDELRGPLPGSIRLVPKTEAALPAKLNASYQRLAVESLPYGGPFEMVVRDAETGFVFFNIEGHEFKYEPNGNGLSIENGRLLMSGGLAAELGRPRDAGSIVGKLTVSATVRPIEVTQIVDGEVKSSTMPPGAAPNVGTNPGPDVVVGDLSNLQQFGSAGTQVGLAVATDSCNFGTEPLNWFALPANDHPVIPQNLYRMSGGATNDERFEQIGQSHVKHGFTALQQNLCNLGCAAHPNGTRLGSGCSDPYSASLNAGPNLGSRAWINPFTGAFPRGDSATPPNNHSGHSHDGVSHRIAVEAVDLNTAQNAGATYYAESSYVTPHEYAWCQANPTQCNMYNNTSYRRFNVSGTTGPFSFSAFGSTVREQPAINAWPGATRVAIQPDPGNDGTGVVAYKVTNPSPGVWHYEYAVYNETLDRAIQSFSVPVAAGAALSNIDFHAPPQHPGWANDGTVGNSGYSNAPWAQSQAGGSMTWSTQTFAQNPNANAIRWATLYNFRFNSNRPPTTVNATVGFFKSGAPITVAVQGPGVPPTPTPTPTPNLSICTPSLTVTEVSPGSLAAFEAITAGPNSVTVDAADSGVGLQGLTVVSSTNANVSVPPIGPGTYGPVSVTFTIPSPGQAVDFTLRASSRVSAILIRAQCGAGPAPTPTPTPTATPTPTPTATPTATPTPTPTPTATPTPNPTPTPTPSGPCTPALTVSEAFPGSAAAFEAITAGPGTVTIDPANSGAGMQSLTLVSSSNANVNIPAFPFGTTDPVTVTFTVPNPGQPVDFTLRAGARVQAVFIRAQCSAGRTVDEDETVSRSIIPDVSFWLPQTVGRVFSQRYE